MDRPFFCTRHTTTKCRRSQERTQGRTQESCGKPRRASRRPTLEEGMSLQPEGSGRLGHHAVRRSHFCYPLALHNT